MKTKKLIKKNLINSFKINFKSIFDLPNLLLDIQFAEPDTGLCLGTDLAFNNKFINYDESKIPLLVGSNY